TVACVDRDTAKVATLTSGRMTIYEPGLEEIVRRNVAEERLAFTTDLAASVQASQIVFIAVGTPQGEDGSADLRHVLDVAHAIGRSLNRYTVVVDKSTVPVGTAAKVKAAIAAETSQPFSVVSNPEFLKQGAAVDDFMKPDRVVVGVEPGDERAAHVMRELYAPFTRTGAPVLMTDTASAELCKYAANSILATRISFMNEIANLCEKVGANVDLVRKGIGSDARIGSSFLFPGPGYGGSCFPKDVQALMRTSGDVGAPMLVLQSVEDANHRQKHRLFEKLTSVLGTALKGAQIAVWGLAFKAQTDDMRESPALTLIEEVLGAGAAVVAHDPAAMHEAARRLGTRITFASTNYDALAGADALVVVTDWNEYRFPDFARIKAALKRPVVIDGRNLYDPAKMNALGFTYRSFGRGRE
ncbi:MAG: UDP-glucose dehydrogenase family protein, partial [Gemmatimonadaceae bacterium]